MMVYGSRKTARRTRCGAPTARLWPGVRRSAWLGALFFICALLWGRDARAFHIQSPKTQACHEYMMLGALGKMPAPFSSADAPPTGPLFAAFTARAESAGIPGDKATRAFIRDVAKSFGFSEQPLAEQFVLASFIAGVRQADSHGRAVNNVNEMRAVHLLESNQRDHSLRTNSQDDEAGEIAAIIDARAVIEQRTESALKLWRSEQITMIARWTLPYYPPADVDVFGPAFQLGRAIHTIQDAFAHTLRDDAMRIVAVANFTESIQDQYYEPRDGPAHSDRMDRCEVDKSAFDAMRIAAASEAGASLLNAISAEFSPDAPRDGAGAPAEVVIEHITPVLDQIFAYRPGCTPDNNYCDSQWTAVAKSELTKPYKLALCATSTWQLGQPPPTLPLALIALFSGAGLLRVWRRTRPGSRGRPS